jgi:hypothetical protein
LGAIPRQENNMTLRLTLILLTISTVIFGQTEKQTDSLISVMCKSIKNNERLKDSTRLILVYGEHLFPFVERYDEKEREKITEKIYYRFQRNCRDFSDLLDRLNPPSEYWEKVADKPKSKLTKKQCQDFLKHKNYTYPDSNGDTVNLVIDKGLWTDNYKNGTYSKLKFKWINDNEFEIEFIESNNSIQSQFSKKGDKYIYQIIDKADDHYLMSVQVPGTEGYYLFHMGY